MTVRILYILREINLAICYRAESFQTYILSGKLPGILFLLCKCTILDAGNTKNYVESLFIEPKCVGFVPMGSTKKVS